MSAPGRPTTLVRGEMLALLAALALLVLVLVPDLGSQAWPFRPDRVEPQGPLAPLVRAAGREWDLGIIRASALFAALVVAAAGAVALSVPRWPRWLAVALVAVVLSLVTVPATLLQVGLREATEPWLFVNDSTYQIELAGELVLDGDTPYGHDYEGSGLERFYPAVGFDPEFPQVALTHFAYFPGTALSAAVWRLLPAPLDDYRILVLLATLGSFAATLLIPAPLVWRLAAGAVVAANPLAVRAAWFGTADMPSMVLVILSIALAARRRPLGAAACLAGAVLLKQFALVAVPFVALMLVIGAVDRRTLGRAAAVFAGVFAVGTLPFLVADPGALWSDTIAYGAQTYRIIGYGLAGILVEAGAIDDRFDPYPFALLALLVWAPVTAWLVVVGWRTRSLAFAAAGFAISIFVLLYLGRVLHNSYLVWPLTGVVLAALLASRDPADRAAP